MNDIKLTPKTLRGKNKIANVLAKCPEWDKTWRIIQVKDSVPFSPGERGPWWMIEPRALMPNNFVRWIKAVDDPDFSVEEV